MPGCRGMRWLWVGALLVALAALAGCSLLAPARAEPWAPSTTGRPTFYYFGDPG